MQKLSTNHLKALMEFELIFPLSIPLNLNDFSIPGKDGMKKRFERMEGLTRISRILGRLFMEERDL